ncbi:MAG: nucleoside deaminase [Bryobacteraceae bacterium]
MRRALDLAVANVERGLGGPFAALVLRDGELIAEGANRVTATNDPTAHAEVVAIREACRALGHFQLAGCEIVTSCEPCPMCLGAIYWARPDRVYYAATHQEAAAAGFDDSLIYQEMKVPPRHRRIPLIHLPGVDGEAPFEAWNRKKDRIPY